MDAVRVGRPTLLEEPKQVTVTVERVVYRQLVEQARARRLSMAELVRRGIDRELASAECGDE